jgi:hypothetical protein
MDKDRKRKRGGVEDGKLIRLAARKKRYGTPAVAHSGARFSIANRPATYYGGKDNTNHKKIPRPFPPAGFFQCDLA